MNTKIKFFIRGILCNNFTGSLISQLFGNSIPDIRWKGYRFRLPPKGVSKTNIAAIFWGFYEAAEIRLIQKYLDGGTDVIEMGGSIGIVSGHIASKLQAGRKYISIEANPGLVDNITSNLKKFAKPGVEYKVLNYAVQYNTETVVLHVSDNNTESRVGGSNEKQDGGVVVHAITLKDIINREALKDFSLVCDIEGSEIEMILFDAGALQNCKNLFIELHEVNYGGKYYSPDDILKKLLDENRFTLIERHGPVCYLHRPDVLGNEE